MKTTTLYQKTKLGKTQTWKIWVVEKGDSGYPEVHIEHGLSDGKKQTTFDVIDCGVNEGKANATTPLQQAYLTMERKITKQKEQGYGEEQDCIDKALDLDWSKPLPKELCFYKPKNSVEDKKLEDLEKAGKAVYTVKRNGQCHIARMSDFGSEIYSRRMDLSSDKYPHLMEVFKSLPPRTILLGEIILDVGGRDNFNIVSSICRSDPEESIAKQNIHGKVKYYVYDIAFLKGKNLLTTTTFKDRRELMLSLVKQLGSKWVIPSEVISKNHKDALQETVNRGLEGLVAWDSLGMISDGNAFTFNGKANRPSVVYKRKRKYEDDFIARWNPAEGVGDFGRGKNKDRVGKVFLYQILDGKEVFISKCGGGLKDSEREFYTNTSLYPRVWKVEYNDVQPGTGSLQHPEFKGDRTLIGDKEVDECLMSDAIKAAREEAEEEESEE